MVSSWDVLLVVRIDHQLIQLFGVTKRDDSFLHQPIGRVFEYENPIDAGKFLIEQDRKHKAK